MDTSQAISNQDSPPHGLMGLVPEPWWSIYFWETFYSVLLVIFLVGMWVFWTLRKRRQRLTQRKSPVPQPWDELFRDLDRLTWTLGAEHQARENIPTLLATVRSALEYAYHIPARSMTDREVLSCLEREELGQICRDFPWESFFSWISSQIYAEAEIHMEEGRRWTEEVRAWLQKISKTDGDRS